jgi:hypothetical protein
MAIFLADKEEARQAYEKGALQEGTVIPEFEEEKSSEDGAA